MKKSVYKNQLYRSGNPTDKISATPMKNERKQTLVPNILSTPIAIVLKHQFLNWSWRELSKNVYVYPLPCVVSELQLIKPYLDRLFPNS